MQTNYNKLAAEMQASNPEAENHPTISMYEFHFRTYDPYREWILLSMNQKQYEDSTELFKQQSWETFMKLKSEWLLNKY